MLFSGFGLGDVAEEGAEAPTASRFSKRVLKKPRLETLLGKPRRKRRTTEAFRGRADCAKDRRVFSAVG
jgi:hypothetical protein